MGHEGLHHASKKKKQQLPWWFLFSFLFLFAHVKAERWDGVVITQADYEGLQAFKRELVDPNGLLRSWTGTGLGACSGAWLGIKCVQGQVIAIQLPWKGLGGHISAKVGQLIALRKLNLHDNSIGGQLPPSLSFLPNLRGLYLFNNLLTGSIPPSIGSCPLLQTLDLSNNSLVGSIPNSISNSTKLYRVNLSHNRLHGSIPEGFTRSPSLTFLSLHYNNLSGTIPDTWGGGTGGAFLLQTLNLDHNSLSGDLPTSLSRLPMLQTLSISNNKINGTFPASLCNLTSLVELSLENNDLESEIPNTVDGLKSLSILSLKNNRFLGPIPVSLGNISTLSRLDLSNNNFRGEIPKSIARLRNLSYLNVSNNNLSGQVPPLLAEKFNSSSFMGNFQLCGYSSSTPCPPPTTHPTLPPPVTHKPNKSKLTTRDIILIAAGSVLALLLFLCCIMLCFLLKKRSEQSKKTPTAATAVPRGEKPGQGSAETEAGGDTGGKLVHFDGPLVFTADDLLCATAEIMGKSTYGTVYKATLEDGNQVGVKRLREKIAKGQREFEAEVNLLGRIRHANLLALRAYYLGPKGEKLLVFDYMPKGSLAAFLHARGPETPVDWPTRMKIAMGTARGLHYLHTHENLVHGNLTSGNVLLDEDTSPRIADFGLSRLMTTAANSNVIATAGALGYRAPELSKLKKANTKTDVYSLGVIVLELLTGKSPSEAMNGMDLPQWVASIVKEEWTNEVFDLELMREASGATGDELLNTLKLALHCVDPTASARPEVGQVLRQLEEVKPELAASAAATTSGAAGEEEGGSEGKKEEA